MSASNWAVCPRCKIRHEAQAERLRADAAKSYGVLPVDEWQALDDAARGAGADFKDQNLREDYEIHGAEHGTVKVNYSAGCDTCGLTLTFESEHDFPPGELES